MATNSITEMVKSIDKTLDDSSVLIIICTLAIVVGFITSK